MNTQRITISLPDYLYQQIIESVPPRKVSQFIANIIEEKVICGGQECDPVQDFLSFRERLPKIEEEEIQKALEKGRE